MGPAVGPAGLQERGSEDHCLHGESSGRACCVQSWERGYQSVKEAFRVTESVFTSCSDQGWTLGGHKLQKEKIIS